MIVNSAKRKVVFEQARALHPALGNLFQNEYELDVTDVYEEYVKLNDIKVELDDKFAKYEAELLALKKVLA